MPWLKFDEKQWEELKTALDRVINVAKEIQVEMNPALPKIGIARKGRAG